MNVLPHPDDQSVLIWPNGYPLRNMHPAGYMRVTDSDVEESGKTLVLSNIAVGKGRPLVSTYRPVRHILTPWRCVVGSLAGWAGWVGYLAVLAAHGDQVPSDMVVGSALMVLACATLASLGWVGYDWVDRRTAQRLDEVHRLLVDLTLRTPSIVVVNRHDRPSTGRASVAAAPSLTRTGMRTAGLDPTIVQAVRQLRRRMR